MRLTSLSPDIVKNSGLHSGYLQMFHPRQSSEFPNLDLSPRMRVSSSARNNCKFVD